MKLVTARCGRKPKLSGWRKHAMAAPLVIVIASASAAAAFDTGKLGYGSLFLGDFMSLIDSSPELNKQVGEALAAAKHKPDEQLCESPRFPGSWQKLHGEHVAPYVCNIGGKWLRIDATIKVAGLKGEVYATDGPVARKRASRISQTQPTWAWTDEDPRRTK